jgi:DNA-binding PucR family transcriptional regulator
VYCHRNTVIYRMRQISELTGRDLSDARDRLLFSLALMAAEE